MLQFSVTLSIWLDNTIEQKIETEYTIKTRTSNIYMQQHFAIIDDIDHLGKERKGSNNHGQ